MTISIDDENQAQGNVNLFSIHSDNCYFHTEVQHVRLQDATSDATSFLQACLTSKKVFQ